MLSGIQLLSVMKRRDKSLSDLANEVEILPQVLVNAKVSDDRKFDYDKDEEILSEIARLEAQMAGQGRVLIRTSGTEPLVRVMIEGKDKAAIGAEAVKIARLIEKKLGGK